ncbi:MAG TPA: thioredoxin family protein [Bacillota bacterium]|nr:thioredoxin family protein [Bacillota bacterium]
MDIKVLGGGCANCDKLEQLVFDVLAEKNMDASVTHVRDFKEIAAFGVMSTSALVINGSVKLSGYVPSKAKVMELIMEEV